MTSHIIYDCPKVTWTRAISTSSNVESSTCRRPARTRTKRCWNPTCRRATRRSPRSGQPHRSRVRSTRKAIAGMGNRARWRMMDHRDPVMVERTEAKAARAVKVARHLEARLPGGRPQGEAARVALPAEAVEGRIRERREAKPRKSCHAMHFCLAPAKNRVRWVLPIDSQPLKKRWAMTRISPNGRHPPRLRRPVSLRSVQRGRKGFAL